MSWRTTAVSDGFTIKCSRGRRGLTVSFEDLALAGRDAVDPAGLDLVAGREQALPAGDGVGAHDGVLGLEVEAVVLRGTAVGVDQLETKGLLDLDKVGLVVRRRQAIDQLLDGR